MQSATGKVVFNWCNLGKSGRCYIAHRAHRRAAHLEHYLVWCRDADFAHAIVERRCLIAQVVQEVQELDVAAWQDRRVDWRPRKIYGKERSPRVVGTKSVVRGDERDRRILLNLDDERTRKPSAHADAAELRVRRQTGEERSHRIPDRHCGVDVKTIHDVADWNVPRADDLHFA